MVSLAHLLTSRDRVFQELFASFAATAVSATERLAEMLAHYPDRHDELLAQIVACEKQGDSTLHEIRARLNQTFVTPIDREDILALAASLDDIIDFTEEAADYLGLYAVEAPMEQSQQLAGLLVEAARAVERAIPSVSDFSDASGPIREVHRLENEGDRLSRDAIAALFRDGIDPMVVIRWKDIYQRLEQGIDACEHAADVIDEIIVKNR
jgi:predicted phosphate transport protein (TIGR00153 family)